MPTINPITGSPFSQPAVGGSGFGTGAVPNKNRPQGMDFGQNVNGDGQQVKSVDLLDSSNSNPLPTTGLAKGGGLSGASSSRGGETNVSFKSNSDDWRVRISVNPNSGVLYRGPSVGILSPLLRTDGVVFPFVPSVTVNYAANYGNQTLTHTNYTNYYYQNSEVQNIQIVGDFAVQNTNDADYFLAVIYFFRAASKMFYGNSGQYQGSPPPILYLNGYGEHYFPNVPCVLTYFNHMLPNDVDYVETSTSTGLTQDTNQARNSNSLGSRVKNVKNRVPTNSTITLQLQPVYSRKRQTEFDHQKFARGDQIDKGFM